jgi:hypothetical protein
MVMVRYNRSQKAPGPNGLRNIPRKRFAIHDDLGKRPDRRRVTLVVGYFPKRVCADGSGLHQYVGHAKGI